MSPSPVFARESAGPAIEPVGPAGDDSTRPAEVLRDDDSSISGLATASLIRGAARYCYCGRRAYWRIRYSRYLGPCVCWRHMSPEERGLVAATAKLISYGLEAEES